MTPPVTVADFKAYWTRGFPYGTDASTTVTDGDIQRALNDATINFNPDLWEAGLDLNTGFLYLAAHFLASAVQMAGGLDMNIGVQNAGGMPISAQTVGSVSLTFELPERWKNDPSIAPFLTTKFGITYVQMAMPRTSGNMQVVAGYNDTGAPNGL